jgi:transposase
MAQGRRRRRRWDDDEKRQIVAQTQVPGVSVSRVGRRYDVNANLVFKWLRDPRFQASEEALPIAPSSSIR